MAKITKLLLTKMTLLIVVCTTALTSCSDPRFTVRTPPGTHIDVFRQASVPKIDILWVVDNSKSMEEEQQALADNFNSFYQYLISTKADFQIGVISTDVYNPEHQGNLLGDPNIISSLTPDTQQVFARNINVGTEGKGDEQAFYAAELALTEKITTTNHGFLREDAHLFIIFVSDEDDRSFGEIEYFLRTFEQIKGIGNDGMVKIAAVVGDVPEVPKWCQDQKNVEPGERYTQLAKASSGIILSICDDDFADNLDSLGFTAAGLKRHFSLTLTPAAETIAVWVKSTCANGAMDASLCETTYNDCGGLANDIFGHTCVLPQSLPNGWAYEISSNSIRFFGEALPPFGAIIEVGYIPEENL
jgi:hypothetical protein